VEFESEEDEDEWAIKAGGNKVGSGEGFFVCSTSTFLGIGGLRTVSEKMGNKHGDQPVLFLWIVVRHHCRDTTLRTGAPELGLESKYLVLGPFEVPSEFQVDLQSLLACFDVFS